MTDWLESRPRRAAALSAILVVSLVPRAWGLTWGLYNANVSRRPHPDEWPVYWLFRWFGANHNLDPCPGPAGQCFFDWGSIYPYLAYATHLLMSPFTALVPAGTFGPHAVPTFVWSVLAGRLTSVALSVATVFVVYKLASEAFSPGAGMLGALVAGASGLPIQLAHFATPDTTTSLLMTSTLLTALYAMKYPSTARFAVTGTLWGLSVGSEYHMLLLGVPILTGWLLARPRATVANLVLAGCCAAGVYLVSNGYALVHPAEFIAAMEHTIRIRTVDSAAQYGDRWTAYGPDWLYVIRYPLGYGVGFGLAAWMLLAAVWAVSKRTKPDLLLLSWLAVYVLLVTLSPAKFMRYSAPLLPVLAVLSGRVAADMVRMPRLWARRLTAAAALFVLMFTGVYIGAYTGLFASTDPRLTATRWLAAQAPTSSRVAFEELPNGLINLPYFAAAAGFRPCFTQFQAGALHDTAPYIMLDGYDLEEHPRVSDAAVLAFRQTLASDKRFRVVFQDHPVPSLLGIAFPIDGSPHDWRYPTHDISIYRQTAPEAASSAACFPSVSAASAALHPSIGKG